MTSDMIRKKSKKHHPEFDLEAAGKLFTGKSAGLSTRHLTSPYHLFDLERGRIECGVKGTAVNVDVFVIGKGEPKQRDITKVGGLPYWPKGKKWPTHGKGTPYRFLAQFNFSDSTDIYPDLPGDILLIFVTNEDDWAFDSDGYHFEWVDLGIEPINAVPEESELPDVYPFFGVIHRSVDYLSGTFKEGDFYEYELDKLLILPGIKIGGAPSFIQDSTQFVPGFLCQLGSIQAVYDLPYPWVNQEKVHSLDFARREPQLSICDMGTIYFFMDKKGKVSSGMDCY